MSDNWTMPAWMRDVFGDDADKIEARRNSADTIYRCLAQAVTDIAQIWRRAGLLLTPREKRGRDITMSELGVAIRGDATLITRLRAENEQMRGLLYEWQGRPEEECLEDIDERTTAALGAEHE